MYFIFLLYEIIYYLVDNIFDFLTIPNGSVTDPNGSVTVPNGLKSFRYVGLSKEVQALGNFFLPFGTVTKPFRSVIKPFGIVKSQKYYRRNNKLIRFIERLNRL